MAKGSQAWCAAGGRKLSGTTLPITCSFHSFRAEATSVTQQSYVPVQMRSGEPMRTSRRSRRVAAAPSPGADGAGVNQVTVQLWQGASPVPVQMRVRAQMCPNYGRCIAPGQAAGDGGAEGPTYTERDAPTPRGDSRPHRRRDSRRTLTRLVRQSYERCCMVPVAWCLLHSVCFVAWCLLHVA